MRHLISAALITLLLLTGFSQPILDQELIPEERRINWNPGIPGGIPHIRGPVENVLDHGADPTGLKDSQPAFVKALEALPSSGGVILIPEGSFRLDSKLSIHRKGIVLRGSGYNSRLLSGAKGSSIEIASYDRGSWQILPEDALKGAFKVRVADGSGFSPGMFAEIDQENDPDLMYTDPKWKQDWAEHSVGQLVEIESVEGNQLVFKSPLHFTFTMTLDARIRPMNLLRNVGIENLYIEKTRAQGHSISFGNSAYCWIRNIESKRTRKMHVHLSTSLGNEIRESYFHLSHNYGGGGSGYGVECGTHVTSTLVENNIFDSLRHAMLIQVGANGNVFGYNYSAHPIQDEGDSGFNQDWDPPDISIHGHYPFMNLFEGNQVVEIGIGDWWGPAGPGNTFFRNKVTGEGIVYHDASHGQNLLGNVSTRIRDPEGKSLQKLEHGNVIGGVVRWDEQLPSGKHLSRKLPESLYLDSVPDFFKGLPWPPYGPDTQSAGQLPAELRSLRNNPVSNKLFHLFNRLWSEIPAGGISSP